MRALFDGIYIVIWDHQEHWNEPCCCCSGEHYCSMIKSLHGSYDVVIFQYESIANVHSDSVLLWCAWQCRPIEPDVPHEIEVCASFLGMFLDSTGPCLKHHKTLGELVEITNSLGLFLRFFCCWGGAFCASWFCRSHVCPLANAAVCRNGGWGCPSIETLLLSPW